MSEAMRRAGTIVLWGFLLAPGALAQNAPQPRLLTVSGIGEVKVKPNRATLSAGVVTDGKTAGAALAANSRAMNAVFDTLHRFGIPERAIQTSQLSVQPQYPNDSRQPRRVVGYQVSNTVSVTLDDIDKVGAAVDALVSSGANTLGDIAFSVRDAEPLQSQAREAAVKDAMARAETLARAAGVRLGPIQQISEGGSAGPPQPMIRMAMAADTMTPVAPGEETVSASVSVSWEIR
ncbi:MAG: SIMPL domain-containing protein [Alphaproteobacteria bacterium]|nr:SIMPL domain-containing protein [Alphaproteobacteria bacterium]